MWPIRGYDGYILLSSWRIIRNCASMEEVKLMVHMNGIEIELAMEWINKPMIIEYDHVTTMFPSTQALNY